MCGNPEDAEEVAQETLLKVFESFDQLRDPAAVRAWVFRVAKNACLMHRRKSIFAPASEVSIEDSAIDPDSPELLPDSQYLHGELRAVLNRLIAELPPPYRAVVLLRDIGELSTEETAEILDVSPDVVKTRLHRGRAAMRQKLDCYWRNQCMEGQPTPSPSPLSAAEREALRSVWRPADGGPGPEITL